MNTSVSGVGSTQQPAQVVAPATPEQRPVPQADAVQRPSAPDMTQQAVQLFNGIFQLPSDLNYANGVTYEQVQGKVSKELFDLIANGMKTSDEVQGSDNTITADEIEGFVSNVALFMQMAQLDPNDTTELARVASLYNKNGGQYTRVNISDLQQIGGSIAKAWQEKSQKDPYQAAAGILQGDANQIKPVLDGISRKINGGKDYGSAGDEGCKNVLVALAMASHFGIDIYSLYEIPGERPAASVPQPSVQDSAATAPSAVPAPAPSAPQPSPTMPAAGTALDSAAQEAIKSVYEKILANDMPGAKAAFEGVKDKLPSEVRAEFETMFSDAERTKPVLDKLLAGDFQGAKQALESARAGLSAKTASELQKQIDDAEKLQPILAKLQEGDIKGAKEEYNKICAGMTPEQLKMCQMALISGDLDSGNFEDAKASFQAFKGSFTEQEASNIEAELNNAEILQPIAEKIKAKDMAGAAQEYNNIKDKLSQEQLGRAQLALVMGYLQLGDITSARSNFEAFKGSFNNEQIAALEQMIAGSEKLDPIIQSLQSGRVDEAKAAYEKIKSTLSGEQQEYIEGIIAEVAAQVATQARPENPLPVGNAPVPAPIEAPVVGAPAQVPVQTEATETPVAPITLPVPGNPPTTPVVAPPVEAEVAPDAKAAADAINNMLNGVTNR
jgi:hypothetical protein